MRPPKLNYLPGKPRYPHRHKIGLIGCGGIAQYHLAAAQAHGVEVVALADIRREAAEALRDKFCPRAEIYTDHRDLLAREDITVVEVATHPSVRVNQVADALRTQKHVLSQKPFTYNLGDAKRLIRLAERRGLSLGVNQNGRWAPQFAALLAAVKSGLLGEVHSLDLVMAWDHTWCRGLPFEKDPHLILGDFGIHWFDIVAQVFAGREPRHVFANAVPAPRQDMAPPMLANAVVNYGDGLATLGFSAYQSYSPREYICCVGSQGTLRGAANVANIDRLEFTNARGTVEIPLVGKWFPDGFRGTLGEFLRALEEGREASISARDNLRTLDLTFAALASSCHGRPVRPGTVRALPRRV